MIVDSSRCTRSFCFAAVAISDKSSFGMYRIVLPFTSYTVSVRFAMNLCNCPVKSPFTVSGHVVFSATIGTYKLCMSFNNDCKASAPFNFPNNITSDMFFLVTCLSGSLIKYTISSKADGTSVTRVTFAMLAFSTTANKEGAFVSERKRTAISAWVASSHTLCTQTSGSSAPLRAGLVSGGHNSCSLA